MIEAALSRFLLLGAMTAAPDAAPSEEAVPAAIADLEVRRDPEALHVSFEVRGALDADVLDRLRSGLEVTFRHRVELLARRPVPVIPSRVLGRTVIETSARYDSLTRQYYLTRRTTRESSARGSEPTLEETSGSAASLTDTEAWMCSLRDVPLPLPPPDNERKLRVRVRSVLGRRYRLLVFPTDDAVDAERVLER